VTGEEPDQGGRSDVLHQKHVRFQTLEDVDPTELGASGTHPQHDTSGKNHFGGGPCGSIRKYLVFTKFLEVVIHIWVGVLKVE